MEKEIFRPLGMLRSTADVDKGLADSNLAIGHKIANGRYVPSTSLEFVKPFAPAGSIFSSASEMAKYLELELNLGLLENGQRFIGKNNLSHRRKPQTELNGMLGANHYNHYALGWLIGKHKGLDLVAHAGSTTSYESQFSFYPEKKLGIVILTNGLGQDVYKAIEEKIFELWFDSKEGSEISLKNIKFDYQESDKSLDEFDDGEFFYNERGFPLVEEQRDSLDRLIGTYHNEFIERVQIKKIKNSYWLERDGGNKMQILSANKDGGHEFVVRNTYAMENIPMKVIEHSFSLDGGRDEIEYVFTPVSKGKDEL